MNKKQPPLKRTRELEFRATETEQPGAVGVANWIGGIDSYSTITHPNSPAFSESERAWTVENGAFLSQHKWGSNPIGFINEVTVEGRSLMMDVAYHSTDDAEEARTIAKERKDAGKSVGWSIGFDVQRYEWFENGAKCIAALEARNEDMSKYDVEGIRAHGDDCWLMWIERIFEVSQVNFASSYGSGATAVREVAPAQNDKVKTALLQAIGKENDKALRDMDVFTLIGKEIAPRFAKQSQEADEWIQKHSKKL